MKVAVGSSNPVKLAAVASAFQKVWSDCEVVSVSVSSGVSDMPFGDDEAVQGAVVRAKSARETADADFGVGLEGFVVDSKRGLMMSGWVAVVDRDNKQGIGSCGHVVLPEKIALRVRAGEELGPVTDSVIGDNDIKKKQGTVGVLTGGFVSRKDGFERGVFFALARFLNEDLYS